jgi:hypothetical protein
VTASFRPHSDLTEGATDEQALGMDHEVFVSTVCMKEVELEAFLGHGPSFLLFLFVWDTSRWAGVS